MKKLVILAPDQEDPSRVFWETFGVSAVITIVLLFIFASQVVLLQQRQARAKADAPDGPPPSFEVAKTLKQYKQSILAEKFPWTYEQLEAAINHGPKWLSEKACTFVYEDKKQPQKVMTEKQKIALERMIIFGLKKHISWAPHACMVRAHLDSKLIGQGELEPMGKLLWENFRDYQLSFKDSQWILKEYRTSRRRPTRKSFYNWLRFCGMRHDIVLWHDCLKFLRQISPSQGYDFVDMLEKHLLRESMTDKTDVEVVTSTYANILRKGYPPAWPPLKRHMHKNYDRDARATAALQLCRMLNSPDKHTVEAASDALSFGAQIQARPQTAVARWRLACMGLFGGHDIKPPEIEAAPVDTPAPAVRDDTKPPVPKTPPPKKDPPKAVVEPDQPELPELVVANDKTAILVVWSGKKDELPDYSLTSAIKAGRCKKGLRPAWRCVGELWTYEDDDVSSVVQSYFVKTRFLEQADLWQIPTKIVRARPEKTLPRKMMTMDEWTKRKKQNTKTPKTPEPTPKTPPKAPEKTPEKAPNKKP